ncbi:MAG TPA: hypothetical protein PKO15_15955 [Fibrobacteria bacterium]|nr:hypothetical protein [Fibrobacteria bacterium]
MTPLKNACGAIAAALSLSSPSWGWLQSRATQGTVNQQQVQILNVSVRATVEQAWADVEEDVEVGPVLSSTWATQPTANINTWEIFGDFALPKGAVLTGALLWDGDKLLKAKLKARATANAQYEEVVARNTAPMPAPRDPLIIERSGESTYSLKLYPVSWGGSRKMRLRYLVPLQANGSAWEVPLGSAFAENAMTHPSTFEFEWSRGKGSNALLSREGVLQPPSSTPILLPLSAPSSWINNSTAYFSPVAARLSLKGAFALSTQFDSTSWKGGYLLFQGSMPDSILKQTGLRQEFMVLWRWNRAEPLATDNGWGMNLTATGEAIFQGAFGLRQSLSSLAQASTLIKVGLVADEGRPQTKSFPLSAWGSDTFARMQEYLASFTWDEILRRGSSAGTGSTPITNPTKLRSQGAQSFSADLQQVFSMYSPDSGVVRHLVVVTAGPAEDMDQSNQTIPVWPEGLSVSTWNGMWALEPGHWEGVDLRRIETEHGLVGDRTITSWLPFATPNTPLIWSLEFESGSKIFNKMSISGLNTGVSKPVSAAFHAMEAWKQRATWKIYDHDGNLRLTKPITDLQWIDLPNDTAVAMLWGNSEDRWSDIWRSREVGSVFGFVDRMHSLLALPSDTIGKDATARYRNTGVPYLLASEIFAASGTPGSELDSPADDPTHSLLNRSRNLESLSISMASKGLVKLALPQGLGADAELVIRDLRGRVVMRWNASQLAGLGSLEWRIPPSLGRTMLTVELRSGSERVTRTVMAL